MQNKLQKTVLKNSKRIPEVKCGCDIGSKSPKKKFYLMAGYTK